MKHSVLCLSSVLIALISSVCNSSAMALDPPSHDTLAYTHELKPMPQAYQLARATFLPEASKTDFKFSGNTTEGDYNYVASCEDKSKLYTTSNCKYPRAVVSSSRCPFLAGYYTECKCLSQFNKTSCTAPYVLGGTSCDGKYEKCVCPATVSLTSANDKCAQYCDGKCIKKSCTPTANQSNCTNGTQNCDNGCGQNTRKCCIACTHKITTKPANSSYTYSSCNDGSGSHQIQTGWKCNTGYHEKNGSCEKDCIANTCSGYTLSACPANATCSSCSKQTTTCGGGATMYKMTGCNSGYHQSGNTCVAHSYSCPSGYQASSSGMTNPTSTPKVCSCGATSGSCYKESHSHSYSCPSGYQASACSSSQVQTGTTSKKCSCGATSGTCYKCETKTCEADYCNGQGYSTSPCPTHGKCSTCTIKFPNCTNGPTLQKLISCESGYYHSGNSCIQCEQSCDGFPLNGPNGVADATAYASCLECSGVKKYKVTSCSSGYSPMDGGYCQPNNCSVQYGPNSYPKGNCPVGKKEIACATLGFSSTICCQCN